jgi:DNA integrity scanning protein DisA with diadenylate cyclase activity
MTGPAYPPARAVAAKIQEHFATLPTLDGIVVGAAPDSVVIEEMINAAFWASLRREEGYVPTISLAFLPPEHSERPMIFQTPIALIPEALVRLAPAVERPGIHLGVWHQGTDLMVWGTTRSIPTFCFVLEVVSPGLIVVKHRRADESGKFINVAVLEGEEIKVLLHEAAAISELPELVKSLLGFDSPNPARGKVNVLVQLAVSMRAHHRGGALLVVPANSDAWADSTLQPMRYAVSPSYAELADVMAGNAAEPRLRRAIDTIAGLTAIDGATVITDRYELLAFGVKIVRRYGWPQVERVVLTEPVEGSTPTVAHPSAVGGTRHLSAAQFVQDQRDAVALVASQDGHFTIFAWSESEDMVHGHRVESLLL